MLSLEFIAAVLGGEISGDQVLAPGPGHSDKDRSLAIKPVSTAPDGMLVHSFAGDDPVECKDYVRDRLGLPPWSPPPRTKASITDYIYRLDDDTPYLRVRRTRDKKFWQERWNGSGWEKGRPDGPKIPYRLPQLIKADEILVCEGEKDADRVAALGLAATTNSEGAGHWSADLNHWFAGKTAYVLPDNDEPGRQHARKVARNLRGVAREVRVVALPGLPEKGDVSDWLSAGGTAETLLALCRAAPVEPPGPAADGAVVVRLADVEPVSVKWLWPPLFALGKLSIVAGHPGLGKSQLTIDIAARVSRGAGFPSAAAAAPPGNVIIMSAEDDTADTLRPRFDAAGGDPSRVHVLEFHQGGRRPSRLRHHQGPSAAGAGDRTYRRGAADHHRPDQRISRG